MSEGWRIALWIDLFRTAIKFESHCTVNDYIICHQLIRQGSSDSSDSESSSGEEEAGGVDSAVGEDARETHAGAEISALVNYVQPVHFSSFENSESELYNSLALSSWL